MPTKWQPFRGIELARAGRIPQQRVPVQCQAIDVFQKLVNRERLFVYLLLHGFCVYVLSKPTVQMNLCL